MLFLDEPTLYLQIPMLLTDKSYLILQISVLHGQTVYLHGFVVIFEVAACVRYELFVLIDPPHDMETENI